MTVETIFPQIAEISSVSLKGAVIRTWEEATRRGGWTLDDLEIIPFTLLTNAVGVSLAIHTRAVTDCSTALGRVLREAYRNFYTLDWDILVAGAILHDVGKTLEYRRTAEGDYAVSDGGRHLRHPISGCALAAEMCLPEKVQHIIAVHSREGDGGYRTPEAWIVHHADFVNFEPLRQR